VAPDEIFEHTEDTGDDDGIRTVYEEDAAAAFLEEMEQVVPWSKLSVAEWLQKHAAVSEDDFLREPHRNRFTILLGRTAHIAYHFGQAKLSERVQT
jgi:hypothetical protein